MAIKEIYLAGGCFWGVEKYFALMEGVKETTVGYANGNTTDPTYEEVCHQNTGHAETVKVEYDPDIIRLEKLLEMYYQVIDPVSVNRQGGDAGPQYRTGIYYTDEGDAKIIRSSLLQLQQQYEQPLAIEAEPLRNFFVAEEYHQNYLDKNPTGYCHIAPGSFEKAKSVGTVSYQKKSEAELRKLLSPLQYKVTRENATEPPYQNEYNNHFEKGIYVDITTGEPLFCSTDKFESGCGWPAFSKPIKKETISEREDRSLFSRRTEVRSKTGDAHLGHVFDDGPEESGGLRYCINSAALKFIPVERMAAEGYGAFLSLLEED